MAPGDALFAYVYLDPTSPPSEVMLQWYDGTRWARAYWGANALPWGVNGSAALYPMGPLPAAMSLVSDPERGRVARDRAPSAIGMPHTSHRLRSYRRSC